MRFHCATNPNFNLRAPSYGVKIQFTDGYYETEDPTEIRLLKDDGHAVVADSKSDLYEQAKELDIEGRSELSKDELAEEVIEETVPPKEELA